MDYKVVFVLIICTLFPLVMDIVLGNIVKGQENQNEEQIKALNKKYYDYQKQCKEIKTLSNCIIEVEHLDSWDYIEYRKKFKTKATEVVLEI